MKGRQTPRVVETGETKNKLLVRLGACELLNYAICRAQVLLGLCSFNSLLLRVHDNYRIMHRGENCFSAAAFVRLIGVLSAKHSHELKYITKVTLMKY